MFIKLLLFSAIIILISVAGLGLSILIKKNGRFPDTHVGHNKNMRKMGIGCAKNVDVGCNPIDTGSAGCAGCGIKLS